jgi:hypothetical protein
MKSFAVLLTVAQALYFTLPGYQQLCFGLTVGKGGSFHGTYVISGQGERNVLVRVVAPGGIVQFTSPPRTSEGSFDLTSTEGGTHDLCFRVADSTQKTIAFEYSASEIKEAELATEMELDPLQDSIAVMAKSMDKVYRNIHFFERRERVHRDLAERTCDRVLWSALVKMFVLAIITCLQVYVLRGFFDSKTSKPV